MKTGVCKNHQKEPVVIYGKCIGCEIEYYQSKISDRDKTINELREQIYGELEVSEQVVQEREELILENEELKKLLEQSVKYGQLMETMLGISAGLKGASK